MSDSNKALITALFGLIAGVLVTYFGVEKLNELVVQKSVQLGEQTGELNVKLQTENEKLAEFNKQLEDKLEELSATEVKTSQVLASIKLQQEQLKGISEEITKLLSTIENLKGEDATENLLLVDQLLADINKQSGAERFLALEKNVESKQYTKVLTGRVKMSEQGTRGLRDGSKCPEGTDAYRGTINKRITFAKPFSTQPEVILNFSNGTIGGSDFRINLETIGVDETGFNYRFNTYCTTKVYSAEATWIAVGV